MNKKEIINKWPDENRLTESMIRDYDGSLPAIKTIREETELSLTDTKRIILAIQNGLSLEEFESSNFPLLRKSIELIENEWDKY